MPSINKYYSQWDEDGKPHKGLCAETCLKMADTYYHDREIPLREIVANGDGDGSISTEAGIMKTANWLGLSHPGYFWGEINQQDLKDWFKAGNLVLAHVNYGLIPAKYKQDQGFKGVHAILLTDITDDGGAVRYADPDFWGSRRNDGWMNNDKWITWADLAPAWKNIYKPYAGLQFTMKKVVEPTPDPCTEYRAEIVSLQVELGTERDEYARLGVTLDDTLEKVARLELSVKDAMAEATSATDLLSAVKGERDTLQQEVTDIRVGNTQRVYKLQEELQKLSDSLSTSANQITEKNKEISSLAEKVKSCENTVETLNDKIKRLTKKKNKSLTVSDIIMLIIDKLKR